MKSRLVSTFLLWLLLLLAAAPASAVMDVQPRNHAWEPSASSYDLAPDVRDGPNLYAYVKQNPWTCWDPDGLKSKSDYRRDMTRAAERRAADYKRLPSNASDRARFGIENRYHKAMRKAQQGIDGITATAKNMAEHGYHVSDEALDDEWDSYKRMNRDWQMLRLNPERGAVEAFARGDDVGGIKEMGKSLLMAALAGELFKAVGNFVRGGAVDANKAPVIIGENMSRVNSYADKVGGETIDGWLAGRKWTPQLNDEFIGAMKADGRQFMDIGPDFGRRLQNRIDSSLGKPASPIYGGERQQLLDYGNYQQLYQRGGKYQGGVPGFDP